MKILKIRLFGKEKIKNKYQINKLHLNHFKKNNLIYQEIILMNKNNFIRKIIGSIVMQYKEILVYIL